MELEYNIDEIDLDKGCHLGYYCYISIFPEPREFFFSALIGRNLVIAYVKHIDKIACKV